MKRILMGKALGKGKDGLKQVQQKRGGVGTG